MHRDSYSGYIITNGINEHFVESYREFDDIYSEYPASYIIGINYIADEYGFTDLAIKMKYLDDFISNKNYILQFKSYPTINVISTESKNKIKCHVDTNSNFIINNKCVDVKYILVCSYKKYIVSEYYNKNFVSFIPLLDLLPMEFVETNKDLIGYDEICCYIAEKNSMVNCVELNECYTLFLNEPCSKIKIRCIDNIVKVPSWLKPLFGNKNPLFIIHSFKINTDHDIQADSFNLIIKWLCELVMRKVYPSMNCMLDNAMDIDQWIHVTDYCNIEILLEFFTGIKHIIQK